MNTRSLVAFAFAGLLFADGYRFYRKQPLVSRMLWRGFIALVATLSGYRWWKRRGMPHAGQALLLACDLCDREAPVRAVPDGFGGSLYLCLVCDCKDWDGKPWRQKAEPRPTAEAFDALD